MYDGLEPDNKNLKSLDIASGDLCFGTAKVVLKSDNKDLSQMKVLIRLHPHCNTAHSEISFNFASKHIQYQIGVR